VTLCEHYANALPFWLMLHLAPGLLQIGPFGRSQTIVVSSDARHGDRTCENLRELNIREGQRTLYAHNVAR